MHNHLCVYFLKKVRNDSIRYALFFYIVKMQKMELQIMYLYKVIRNPCAKHPLPFPYI